MVQKQSINENDILELYITNYSKVYHLREIGELLNKPHTTVKRYLQKLKKIIIEEKKKNANYYTLNINNILTIKYLANCENYRTIKIAEHKTIIKILLEEINKFSQNTNFLIFGSLAETTTNTHNDIDLLIIGKETTELKKTLKGIEKTYGIPIQPFYFTNKEFQKKIEEKNTLTKEIYKKHIILNNAEYFIELFKRL